MSDMNLNHLPVVGEEKYVDYYYGYVQCWAIFGMDSGHYYYLASDEK